LLAPYFVAFAHYHHQRRLAHEVTVRFGGKPAAAPTTGVFAESGPEALASAFFALPPQGDHVILTCASGQDGTPGFAPIGVSDLGDAPHERLLYPPLLEMLDHCFRRSIATVHLVGVGPTALAGLFIARFLRLPVEATYTDAIPRCARSVTRDPFIEELSWKYALWIYDQANVVYVPSRSEALTLTERGVSPGKIRLIVDTPRLRPVDPIVSNPFGPADRQTWHRAAAGRDAA
jgi:hypothetical protein